jgi:hypothetical protein
MDSPMWRETPARQMSYRAHIAGSDTPPGLGCQCGLKFEKAGRNRYWFSYRRPRQRLIQRADARYVAVFRGLFKALFCA